MPSGTGTPGPAAWSVATGGDGAGSGSTSPAIGAARSPAAPTTHSLMETVVKERAHGGPRDADGLLDVSLTRVSACSECTREPGRSRCYPSLFHDLLRQRQ